jgi:hypothetical protein
MSRHRVPAAAMVSAFAMRLGSGLVARQMKSPGHTVALNVPNGPTPGNIKARLKLDV